MRRSRLASCVVGVLAIGSLLAGPSLAASATPNPPPSFHALQAGKSTKLRQTVPVNLVFLGYDDIAKRKLTAELPKQYEPIVRSPAFYNLPGRDVGLHYNFKYNVVDAGRRLEDRFFGYLRHQGESRPLSAFQRDYNDQQTNKLDVSDEVLYIDAPSTERWLKHNAGPELRISPNSYTIYFINWYSRKDFKFHVYTKTDEPDPDTDYNFGTERGSRKLIAWGGTDSRLWFFDPSAGPESWSGSWNVDDADIDGDEQPDYRIPPIWEYAKDGYRDPALLYSDLGKVTRFVGINLLFTTSPLYDPLNTTPEPGGAKVAHIQMLQADPASNGLDYLDARFALAKWRVLEPYYRWRVGVGETDPIDPGAERALNIFSGVLEADDCWNDFGTTFAQLFCYFDQHVPAYVPEYGKRDYVGPIFAFNGTDAQTEAAGLLGYADDNWVDGTQTYVFEFDGPAFRESGYGFTTTTIHEFGHHLGLSHPHDGYDSELALDYGGSGGTYFANSGDESNSIMSYIDLNWDFSRFDVDNMARWQIAGRLNQTNALLGKVLAKPGAIARVGSRLASADRYAQAARAGFARWDYVSAARDAVRSYDLVASAAQVVGVDPSPVTTKALRASQRDVPRYLDPIRNEARER